MNLKTALRLCSFSWIFLSCSDSHTVEVQPGENVTLLTNNMANYHSVTSWFRLVNRTKLSCISRLIKSDVDYCQGYQGGKFKMEFNTSTAFLNIRQVDVSDSGLYFYGFYDSACLTFRAIHLNVKDTVTKTHAEQHDDVDGKCKNESEGRATLTSVILGSLTVFFLMVIIGLVVKNRKLQTAAEEKVYPERKENLGSDNLDSAALKFLSKTVRNRRPASERQEETCVIYAASKLQHWN